LNIQRHLNKVRWFVLTVVFSMLVLLPFIYVYQTFLESHAYDLLADSEKQLYDVMETITSPFVGSDPENELDAIKGTTWSGNFFGYKISDPLAAVGQFSAGLSVYQPLLLAVLLPVILTMFFGRFYCGWICPATFIYEINTNIRLALKRLGFRVASQPMSRSIKYYVLGIGILLSGFFGTIFLASIYPPAIVGREIFYGIALGGFGSGFVFFILTLLFDLLVAKRGFCRYICPGGALYSILGRYRLFRIQRVVKDCNDCAKCNAVCEFGLNPLNDDFGQECNNCTACIAVCPTDALVFKIKIKDTASQGPGHLGKKYLKSINKWKR
jgi:ferredoxin-type protein NapH